MKALIIGGSGFVGGYLAQHLKSLGHETVITKMPSETTHLAETTDLKEMAYLKETTDLKETANLIKTADLKEAADLIKTADSIKTTDLIKTPVFGLDILDKDALSARLEQIKPDVIFHLAAQSSVAVSWKRPDLTIDVNIKGSMHVLEAVRRQEKQIRIVLIGSGEEYGKILEDEIPVSEGQCLRPGNIYAATKACQNMIGSIYAQAYGMDVVMVRPFNHIGPMQAPLFAVSDFCKQAAEIEAGKREPVIKTGNLDVKRDFTDVRDVVCAYALLAEKGKAGETYNVGSGHAVSIREILKIVLEYSTANIHIETDPEKYRPSDVPVMEADIHKIQKLTGWAPKIPLYQSVRETLDSWRSAVC